MAKERQTRKEDQLFVADEPGMAERFQRALRKALNTPLKHQTSPTPKAKERLASKGRVHRGRTRT